MKRCYDCGETKTKAEFFKNRARRDGLSTQCKICHRLSTSESSRWLMAKKRTGAGKEDYERLFELQKGKCAICGCPPSGKGYKHGAPSPFHIDHCHTTGRIRGLLCLGCNAGLGQFRDSKDLLIQAAKYLDAA